jgi:peptidoglycan/xylan/chitin deacetylase (PgdA/CDA1 family)
MTERHHPVLRFALKASGVLWFLRHVVGRNAVPIIMYHDPTPQRLICHLDWLVRHGYKFIELSTLVEAINQRDFSRLPWPCVVITLDDGLKGNRLLLPVFRAYNVKPTIYLTAGLIGTRRRLWTAVARQVGLPHQAIVSQPMNRTLEILAQKSQYSLQTEYPADQADGLSREDLAAMADAVDFQAHTVSHPILTDCDDCSCLSELAQSREFVQGLGVRLTHFAYPFGIYGPREVEQARRVGFASARTTERGWNGPDSDVYRLKVVDIGDQTQEYQIEMALLNMYSFLGRLRLRLFGRRAG